MFTITGGEFRNGKGLEAQLTKAFEQWVNEDLDEYFYDQFHSPIWPYNRDTVRESSAARIKNPKAGELRDIYDYGELYESGKDVSIAFNFGGVEASWNWDARNSSGKPYASYVHEGTGTNYGNPRRWTEELAVPQKFDGSTVKRALMARIQSELSKQ